jgi:hypothetical protein
MFLIKILNPLPNLKPIFAHHPIRARQHHKKPIPAALSLLIIFLSLPYPTPNLTIPNLTEVPKASNNEVCILIKFRKIHSLGQITSKKKILPNPQRPI